MKALQDLMEKAFFNSRWILAPLYIGLVAALVMLIVKFAFMFGHAWHEMIGAKPADPSSLVLAVLELVDVTLVASLVLIIIFSGYENFVSKIDCAEGHKDRPSWMGTIDYSGLKLKIIGSVVAISSIHLLANFMEVGSDAKILIQHAEANLQAASSPADMLQAAQVYQQVTSATSAAENHKMTWKIALHLSFVISGVLFAVMEKITHSTGAHGSKAALGDKPKEEKH